MIELAEACARVRRWCRANEPVGVPLDQAEGCVLAAPVISHNDSPPHAKALVDGYAVQASDLPTGCGQLQVVESIMAGQVPQRTLQPGQAARIMTGAPIPLGADAVVMVESTRAVPDTRDTVWIESPAVRPGQHLLPQGACWTTGQILLPAGRHLGPLEIGVLAETGCAEVTVVRRPQVTLIQTGDELVAVGAELRPGQIRNSNGPQLRSLVHAHQGETVDLGIVADEPAALRAAIQKGLESDLLLVSGGVSQGDRDLVPPTLAELGVECVFHRVAVRPGQPLWFGVYQGSQRTTLVFGLPGNPVSGLVCFLRFVAPALATRSGRTVDWTGGTRPAALAEPFELRGARPAYWPAQWAVQANGSKALRPLSWKGSADLLTICAADGLIFFPVGNRAYSVGEVVQWLEWRPGNVGRDDSGRIP